MVKITFVVAEITFKMVVITSLVVKITFVMAEITFRMVVVTSSVVKITFSVVGCDHLYSRQDHFCSGLEHSQSVCEILELM